MSWNVLVERLSSTPRRLLGLEVPEIADGAVIDAVLFDTGGMTRVDRGFIKSRSLNTPFLDRDLSGLVVFAALGERVLLDRL